MRALGAGCLFGLGKKMLSSARSIKLLFFLTCEILTLIGKQNTAKHLRFDNRFSLYNSPQYSKKYYTSGLTDNVNSTNFFMIISQHPL